MRRLIGLEIPALYAASYTPSTERTYGNHAVFSALSEPFLQRPHTKSSVSNWESVREHSALTYGQKQVRLQVVAKTKAYNILILPEPW